MFANRVYSSTVVTSYEIKDFIFIVKLGVSWNAGVVLERSDCNGLPLIIIAELIVYHMSVA